MTHAVESKVSFGYETGAKQGAEKLKTDAFKKTMDEAVADKDLKGLKDACEQFESFFIQKIFEQMRSSSASVGGFLEKSSARQTFEKMLDEEMSKEMSQAGGIGLSKMLFDNMQKAYFSEKKSKNLSEDAIESSSEDASDAESILEKINP